jgi:hypothetical protein
MHAAEPGSPGLQRQLERVALVVLFNSREFYAKERERALALLDAGDAGRPPGVQARRGS